MAQQAHLVYSGFDDPDHPPGTLFESWDIWIAQRVPSRSTYVQKVQQNGGRIVPLEKIAHIMIADHVRRDAAPGTISYKWIDQCISTGSIVDKEQYLAGPPVDTQQVRPVGSSKAAKGGRNPFTADDDRFLASWVKGMEDAGEKLKGNEIYKQLELQNPRHPWQSWRDRWIKYVSTKPPPPSLSQETPPTPPSDNDRGRVKAHSEVLDSNRLPTGSTVETVGEKSIRRGESSTQQAGHGISKPGPARRKDVSNVQNDDTSRASVRPISRTLPASRSSHSPSRRVSTPRQGQMSNTPEAAAKGSDTGLPFSKEDHKCLLDMASGIQKVMVGMYDEMWEDPQLFGWDNHSAAERKEYYETHVLPEWKESKAGEHDKDGAKGPEESLGSQTENADILRYFAHKDQDLLSESLRRETTPNANKKRKRDTPENNEQTPAKRLGGSKRVSYVDLLDTDDSDAEIPPSRLGQEAEEANFGIYEDREMPEEEKENVVFDESGSYSIPPRHVHVRREEALDAFSDPLPTFTLQNTTGEIDNDLGSEGGAEILGELGDEDDNSAPHVNIEDDQNTTGQEIYFDDFDGSPTHTGGQHDTQAFLDAETQLPDFDVLLPPEDDLPEHDTESRHSRLNEAEGLFVTDAEGESQLLVEEVEEDTDEDEEDEFYEEMQTQQGPNPLDAVVASEGLSAYLDVPRPPDSDPLEDLGEELPPDDSEDEDDGPTNTQDVLDTETQHPDLAVLPPPSSPSQLQDIPSSPPQIHASHPTISTITVRQDIRAQYQSRRQQGQQPQHSLPAPPSSSRHHPSSQRRQQTQPPSIALNETNNQNEAGPAARSKNNKSNDASAASAASNGNDNDEDDEDDETTTLNDFIAAQCALGHAKADVVWALQRTSIDYALAVDFLARYKCGDTLPTGVEGIWTEADDAALQSGDAREIRRIERLHGSEAATRRLGYLVDWADVD